jgi:hypothetical protein
LIRVAAIAAAVVFVVKPVQAMLKRCRKEPLEEGQTRSASLRS